MTFGEIIKLEALHLQGFFYGIKVVSFQTQLKSVSL